METNNTLDLILAIKDLKQVIKCHSEVAMDTYSTAKDPLSYEKGIAYGAISTFNRIAPIAEKLEWLIKAVAMKEDAPLFGRFMEEDINFYEEGEEHAS